MMSNKYTIWGNGLKPSYRFQRGPIFATHSFDVCEAKPHAIWMEILADSRGLNFTVYTKDPAQYFIKSQLSYQDLAYIAQVNEAQIEIVAFFGKAIRYTFVYPGEANRFMDQLGRLTNYYEQQNGIRRLVFKQQYDRDFIVKFVPL